MKTRQQAAEDFATENTFTHDGFLAGQSAFLAGCEHADKEHRDFYLLVREYFRLLDLLPKLKFETQETNDAAYNQFQKINEKVSKHLSAFTEIEQISLPFKD